MSEILVSGKQFHLRNARISYVFELVGDGIPAHVYLGRRLESLNSPVSQLFCGAQDEDYFHNTLALEKLPQEYPTFGHGDLRHGALDIEDAFGGNVLDLSYVSHEIVSGKPALPGLPASFDQQGESKTLSLVLADQKLGLTVTLLYTIFNDCDVIARSVSVKNDGTAAVRLNRVMSASIDFADSDYSLITLSGAWARERSIDCRKLVCGIQGADSARGASSAQRSPFMALTRKGTDEDCGEAIGFALVYSGNFSATCEVCMFGMTRAQIGINDYQFSWLLNPGESFQAPEAVIAYSWEGLSGMSRAFHTWSAPISSGARSPMPAAPCCSTTGKRRPSILIKKSSSKSPAEGRKRVLKCSCWTTAGSATGTTITLPWATGRKTRGNSPPA